MSYDVIIYNMISIVEGDPIVPFLPNKRFQDIFYSWIILQHKIHGFTLLCESNHKKIIYESYSYDQLMFHLECMLHGLSFSEEEDYEVKEIAIHPRMHIYQIYRGSFPIYTLFLFGFIQDADIYHCITNWTQGNNTFPQLYQSLADSDYKTLVRLRKQLDKGDLIFPSFLEMIALTEKGTCFFIKGDSVEGIPILSSEDVGNVIISGLSKLDPLPTDDSFDIKVSYRNYIVCAFIIYEKETYRNIQIMIEMSMKMDEWEQIWKVVKSWIKRK